MTPNIITKRYRKESKSACQLLIASRSVTHRKVPSGAGESTRPAAVEVRV